MRIEIIHAPIPADEIVTEIKQGGDGAVCVFDGIVRDNTRGRKTLYLDYEAYHEMALEQMRGLAAEAKARFGVREVAIVHRLGRLHVGESSVLIVVASAHRGAAFDACRWLIDTLKKTVPIWKRETFGDGVIWADGEPFPEGVGIPGPQVQGPGAPEQQGVGIPGPQVQGPGAPGLGAGVIPGPQVQGPGAPGESKPEGRGIGG